MQTAATVTMSASELERLHWMRALAERRATQREVAGHLGVGIRQVQRLRDAFVESEGHDAPCWSTLTTPRAG